MPDDPDAVQSVDRAWKAGDSFLGVGNGKSQASWAVLFGTIFLHPSPVLLFRHNLFPLMHRKKISLYFAHICGAVAFFLLFFAHFSQRSFYCEYDI